jgi:hypothetical protein
MANCRMLDTSVTGADFRELSYHLMHDANFLPDVLRDYKCMTGAYISAVECCHQPFALVNGDNKMGGAFFITSIIPGHEATLLCWVWDRKAYTSTTHRIMNDYIGACADEYQLSRLVSRTPDDKKLGKLLEHLGFKLEGRFRSGYKSGGKLQTLFQYRRLFNYGGVS